MIASSPADPRPATAAVAPGASSERQQFHAFRTICRRLWYEMQQEAAADCAPCRSTPRVLAAMPSMRLPPTGIVAASSAAAAPPHRSASPDAAATPGSGPRSSAPADAETEAQRAKRVQKQAKDCERWKARLLQSSPIVRFMRDELARAGCPFPPGLFRCQPCDAGAPAAIAGGFVPTQGIVLCQETLVNRDHMEDTMAHELIHAFDQCTTRVDWSQCAHLACSEIRAANLSGDCKFGRELKRGNWALAAKHHQACVKRRAILSLQNAKNCAEGHVAEEAVRHVWPHCFPDTAPFDEIY